MGILHLCTCSYENEKCRNVAACEALAKAEGCSSALRGLREAVDSALVGLEEASVAEEPLNRLEKRLVARARWRLVLDAVPVLVERRWSLVPSAPSATAQYRSGLLPRAYAGHAKAKNGELMTGADWRSFLKDAGILGDGERHVPYLKADLIFTSLARTNFGEEKCLDYRQFRQAMRQAAVALYPQLPEADALKLLGWNFKAYEKLISDFEFMAKLAKEGKIIQGMFVATKGA